MTDKVKCPFCKGSKVWHKGAVPSRKGPKPRYVCYDCGRTFYKPVVVAERKAKRARSRKGKEG